ncbi:MAG: hypothetical protein K8T20_14060 [Planctomycetes bacterium]|nr:hypothetical protein [Planctomycetota bacterium]
MVVRVVAEARAAAARVAQAGTAGVVAGAGGATAGVVPEARADRPARTIDRALP